MEKHFKRNAVTVIEAEEDGDEPYTFPSYPHGSHMLGRTASPMSAFQERTSEVSGRDRDLEGAAGVRDLWQIDYPPESTRARLSNHTKETGARARHGRVDSDRMDILFARGGARR